MVLFIAASALMGCQHSTLPEQAPQKMVNNKFKLPCVKGTSPLIKDTTKLKNMLLASGKITAKMTAQQAEKIVKNYIKKKRDAFKHCKK